MSIIILNVVSIGCSLPKCLSEGEIKEKSVVHLYVYVHRVEGLAPGVYRYWREHAELERIKEGDQRLPVAALSLGQDLAGNACLAFSMIGDFENAARNFGDRR